MKRKTIIIAATGVLIVAAIFVTVRLFVPSDAAPAASPPAAKHASGATHPSLLYGRVTNVGGVVYEGRFRTRDGEEQFWDDLFNGRKPENRWAGYRTPEELPRVRETFEILGVELGHRQRETDLARPFMTRLGDIVRIDASATDVRVTLKSGTVVNLNRLDASDFDDGVRIWDRTRGVVDLDSRVVRSIEMLPGPAGGSAPDRLHGTVRTRNAEFSGFVRWNRDHALRSDDLTGRVGDDEPRVSFETIASIIREGDGSRVTLHDGREIVLSGRPDVGPGNRGIYVEDLRFGRVLVSWDAFERIDFDDPASVPVPGGPSYEDFPPGSPIRGAVTTRDGRRLDGRLVFDLDESEITETLDAPGDGVNYIIPFGLIASVVPDGREAAEDQRTLVILHDGHELLLERRGDLGDENAGILVFSTEREEPDYVPWDAIERLDFDMPGAMYPPVH